MELATDPSSPRWRWISGDEAGSENNRSVSSLDKACLAMKLAADPSLSLWRRISRLKKQIHLLPWRWISTIQADPSTPQASRIPGPAPHPMELADRSISSPDGDGSPGGKKIRSTSPPGGHGSPISKEVVLSLICNTHPHLSPPPRRNSDRRANSSSNEVGERVRLPPLRTQIAKSEDIGQYHDLAPWLIESEHERLAQPA